MLKIELSYNPLITLLGIYPKNTKTLIQRDTCTPMFMHLYIYCSIIYNSQIMEAAQVSTDRQKEDVCVCVCVYKGHTYTMKHYSAIIKNEILDGAKEPNAKQN